MNNTMVNIIRWILIIPTYIASYVIIRLIALGSFTMFSIVGDGLLYEAYEVFIEGIIAPLFSIIAVWKVAPHHKKSVTYVLSGTLCIFFAFSIYLAIQGGGNNSGSSLYKSLITVILFIIINIYYCYSVAKYGSIDIQ